MALEGKKERKKMSDPDFADWVKTNPSPDLRALVSKFGGYDKITPEAWELHEAAMKEWQERRKARKWDR